MTYSDFVSKAQYKSFASDDVDRQEEVTGFIDDAKEETSFSFYGQKWLRAVYLLAAHELTIDGRAGSGVPIMGQLTSFSSSHGSGSVGASEVKANTTNDYLAQTRFGQRLARLRRSCYAGGRWF